LVIDYVADAFVEVFRPGILFSMTLGTVAGIVAGAIPGFTIAMAVILTLPFTFGMSPIHGLSTMLGVFVGGLSGGLISGTLLGIPGTPSSVATTFDAFPMARGGRPGLALGLGVWSSFFGGLLSWAALVFFAPPLAAFGLKFGPWEFFSLILFALTIIASLSGESLLKGCISGLLGLFLAMVGDDEITGIERYTFGYDELRQGFAFLPVLVGLFAFSQLMSDIETEEEARGSLLEAKAKGVRIDHWGAIKEIFRRPGNLLRSSFIGIFVGILPAAGGSISNIVAYDQAKKASRHPEKFGTGIPDGIIASEAANNATAGGALITMMALGIPGDIVTAIMLGALLIHNIIPSPAFITERPDLSYGIFVAFFLAHFIMIALQAVGLRLFLKVVHVPRYGLVSTILLFCAVGIFALSNVTFDVWTLFWFGLLGYAMRKFGFPLAPMIIGVVLGPIAEVNLNRSFMSNADPMLFLTRPISLFFVLLAVISLAFPFWQEQRDRPWARFFFPACLLLMSLPFWLSPGWLKLIGVLFLLGGAYFIRRQWQGPPPAPGPERAFDRPAKEALD